MDINEVAMAATQEALGDQIETEPIAPATQESADEPAESAAPEATTEGKSVAAKDEDAETIADEEREKIVKRLEAMGVKLPNPPLPGREGRIPAGKVQKILLNGYKRMLAAQEKELKGHTDKYSEAEKRLKNLDQVDHLIRTDPERYLKILATIHPNYQQFVQLGGQKAQEQVAKQAEKETGIDFKSMPQPDAKFPDGSMGYSPEGHQKLAEWQAQQIQTRVESSVLAQVDKVLKTRIGPYEEREKAQREIAQRLPTIRSEIAEAREVWGELLDQNQEEIIGKMKAAEEQGQQLSFRAAVQMVLVPKLRKSQDDIRASVIKDIQKAPKGRTASTTSASSTPVQHAANRPLEEIVMEELQRTGVLQ